MTAQEVERLAVVETDIKWLVDWAAGVDKRLDDAISCKADKSEVKTLREAVKITDDQMTALSQKVWAGVGIAAALAFVIPLLVTIAASYIQRG